MKLRTEDFTKVGRVVKDNDVYTVADVSVLEHLNVSLTVLHPGKETGGHSHGEADEVYSFVEGSGEMKVGDDRFQVKKGDIVLIPRGAFHKVFNAGGGDLKFVCVFEKYGDRN
jgi:mannose-6-phosphate isomerase-like protein (cupin superfamily)